MFHLWHSHPVSEHIIRIQTLNNKCNKAINRPLQSNYSDFQYFSAEKYANKKVSKYSATIATRAVSKNNTICDFFLAATFPYMCVQKLNHNCNIMNTESLSSHTWIYHLWYNNSFLGTWLYLLEVRTCQLPHKSQPDKFIYQTNFQQILWWFWAAAPSCLKETVLRWLGLSTGQLSLHPPNKKSKY